MHVLAYGKGLKMLFSSEVFQIMGVFESMSYFLTHPFLAQIATKQVDYFRAICN
jgi:hypothetical protein